MDVTAKKNYGWFIFIVIMAIGCYSLMAYAIPRTSFGILITLTTVLFVLYVFMTAKSFAELYYKELLLFAFLSRMIFLFAIPSLSDDYFRFIWDGVLTNNGINPYLYTPGEVNQIQGMALPDFMRELKANMNSLSYFSLYPPVLQFFFFVGVKLGGNNVFSDILMFRTLALLAEWGTVFTAIKMLNYLKLPRRRVLLYVLNPLVIIELAGNLHGEAFMIFFLSLSFFLLVKNQYFISAVLLGLAVSTKLLPLIFLPVIISFIGTRKGIVYSSITLVTAAVSFVPFVNPVFVQHITQSLSYYFQKFEFNASVYYLLRWIGYNLTGFNLIYLIGIVLPLFSFILITVIAFYKKIQTPGIFFERLLFSLLIYYLFSLIVHPWYITVLVFISVFRGNRFAIAWSALVMLTYSTYTQVPYREILWITALEYILLGIIIFVEFKYRRFLAE